MTLYEYQRKAHSTAVYGGNIVYPVLALTEEISEVAAIIDDPRDTPTAIEKLMSELGDVCWNVMELATVTFITAPRCEYKEEEAGVIKLSPHEALFNLIGYAGKISGAYAKWTRKHGGVEPTAQELCDYAKVDKLVLELWRATVILINSVDMRVVDVLEYNINKLAARKAANTLGGVGSVERKE